MFHIVHTRCRRTLRRHLNGPVYPVRRGLFREVETCLILSRRTTKGDLSARSAPAVVMPANFRLVWWAESPSAATASPYDRCGVLSLRRNVCDARRERLRAGYGNHRA